MQVAKVCRLLILSVAYIKKCRQFTVYLLVCGKCINSDLRSTLSQLISVDSVSLNLL